MLEQPFPAHLKGESEAMLEEWRRVKAVADEQGISTMIHIVV